MKASQSNLVFKWLSRDGTALTEWVELPWMPIEGAQLLMDGSIVTSHWGELNGRFVDAANCGLLTSGSGWPHGGTTG
jgi:hypothetical protein